MFNRLFTAAQEQGIADLRWYLSRHSPLMVPGAQSSDESESNSEDKACYTTQHRWMTPAGKSFLRVMEAVQHALMTPVSKQMSRSWISKPSERASQASKDINKLLQLVRKAPRAIRAFIQPEYIKQLQQAAVESQWEFDGSDGEQDQEQPSVSFTAEQLIALVQPASRARGGNQQYCSPPGRQGDSPKASRLTRQINNTLTDEEADAESEQEETRPAAPQKQAIVIEDEEEDEAEQEDDDHHGGAAPDIDMDDDAAPATDSSAPGTLHRYFNQGLQSRGKDSQLKTKPASGIDMQLSMKNLARVMVANDGDCAFTALMLGLIEFLPNHPDLAWIHEAMDLRKAFVRAALQPPQLARLCAANLGGEQAIRDMAQAGHWNTAMGDAVLQVLGGVLHIDIEVITPSKGPNHGSSLRECKSFFVRYEGQPPSYGTVKMLQAVKGRHWEGVRALPRLQSASRANSLNAPRQGPSPAAASPVGPVPIDLRVATPIRVASADSAAPTPVLARSPVSASSRAHSGARPVSDGAIAASSSAVSKSPPRCSDAEQSASPPSGGHDKDDDDSALPAHSDSVAGAKRLCVEVPRSILRKPSISFNRDSQTRLFTRDAHLYDPESEAEEQQAQKQQAQPLNATPLAIKKQMIGVFGSSSLQPARPVPGRAGHAGPARQFNGFTWKSRPMADATAPIVSKSGPRSVASVRNIPAPVPQSSRASTSEGTSRAQPMDLSDSPSRGGVKRKAGQLTVTPGTAVDGDDQGAGQDQDDKENRAPSAPNGGHTGATAAATHVVAAQGGLLVLRPASRPATRQGKSAGHQALQAADNVRTARAAALQVANAAAAAAAVAAASEAAAAVRLVAPPTPSPPRTRFATKKAAAAC